MGRVGVAYARACAPAHRGGVRVSPRHRYAWLYVCPTRVSDDIGRTMYSDTVPLGGVDLLSPVWLENMDLIDLLLFVTGFAVVGPFLSLQRMRR